MQWLNDGKTLQRVSTYLPAQFEVVDPSTQPRFPRNTIFDDVSEAIAKVSLQAAGPLAAHPEGLCLQSVVCESCLVADRGRSALLQQCCFSPLPPAMQAIQLLHRSVSQMAFPDDDHVVGTMISMLPNDTITGYMASCVRLPIFSFATPKTRFGMRRHVASVHRLRPAALACPVLDPCC